MICQTLLAVTFRFIFPVGHVNRPTRKLSQRIKVYKSAWLTTGLIPTSTIVAQLMGRGHQIDDEAFRINYKLTPILSKDIHILYLETSENMTIMQVIFNRQKGFVKSRPFAMASK